MKIKIIQVGETKDKYLKDGTDELLKRISPFAKIEVVNLKEIPSSKTYPLIRSVEEEGEQILKTLRADEYVVALDELGKGMSSTEFAGFLSKNKDKGQTICFVIGGAFGLSSKVKERANFTLSFSEMTFTHQMVRIFLLEQIYRGLCITNGKEYHH